MPAPTEVKLVKRSEIATTRRSATVVITTRMIGTVNRLDSDIVSEMSMAHAYGQSLATIGPFGHDYECDHISSVCVLASTSTLLAENVSLYL